MRKIQDHYFRKAKEERYLARSVYKLEEMDERHRLVKGGMRVLDFGCAPGSWCQYLLQKVGDGAVTGVDLWEKVSIRDARFRYVRGDILRLEPADLEPAASGRFDLVTSDAAPDTTGHRFTDSQRSLDIVRRVFELARGVLKPGGTVVAKVFEGEDLKGFVELLKKEYAKVSLFKPRSSRRESKELYIIARERRAGSD